MNIGRLLIIGFVGLSFAIVGVLTFVFLNEMKKTTQDINIEFLSTIDFVQQKNQSMLDRIGTMNQETEDIATQIGEEQMRLVGETVANDLRTQLETSFANTRTATDFLLSYRQEEKKLGRVPNRTISDQMIKYFISQNPEYFAVWSAWEPEAYDQRDADFIDVDVSKPEGEQNPTGRYFPWFTREDDNIRFEYMLARECETEDYYLLPKNTKQEWIIEPYLDETVTPPVLMTSFCIPIVENEKFLGVFGSDIPITGLSEMLLPYKPFVTGYAILVSPKGVIAAHPNPLFLMKSLQDFPDMERTIDMVKTGRRGYYRDKAFSKNEKDTLKYHVPVTFGKSPDRWTVIVLADVEQVMKARNEILAASKQTLEDVQKIGRSLFEESDRRARQINADNEERTETAFFKTLGLGGFVLLLACVIGVVFSGKVNRSIRAKDHWYRQILNTANSPFIVLDNNYDVSFLNKKSLGLLKIRLEDALGKPSQKVWNNDIRQIAVKVGTETAAASAFQTMTYFGGAVWEIYADVLRDEHGRRIGFIEFLQDVSDREKIFKMVDQVKRVVDVTSRETSEITSDATHLSHGAEQQAESLNTISAMIGDMSNTATKNASRAQDANRITQDVVNAAAEGQKQMEQMVYSMRQISENARNTQQVVKSIDEIAFQTNLLALNAAVEAARAGTHGKGFSVVAEEVRNLAARSAKAAHETEDMIKHNNMKIKEGVEIVNQTAGALNEIAELISQTTNLISEIAASSDTQTQSVRKVDSGLKNVSSVTQQNSDAARQTAGSASELNKAVDELSNLVNQMTTV
ncbi:MAG: methyl-accepting chemotaxis protein [Planctomycetaceae bacterium]|jgi:methyl-accepting chemotaxis protein|nr:methyl-accepting chemotaxis protein [Planctomycetaceae bacterium]